MFSPDRVREKPSRSGSGCLIHSSWSGWGWMGWDGMGGPSTHKHELLIPHFYNCYLSLFFFPSRSHTMHRHAHLHTHTKTELTPNSTRWFALKSRKALFWKSTVSLLFSIYFYPFLILFLLRSSFLLCVTNGNINTWSPFKTNFTTFFFYLTLSSLLG